MGWGKTGGGWVLRANLAIPILKEIDAPGRGVGSPSSTAPCRRLAGGESVRGAVTATFVRRRPTRNCKITEPGTFPGLKTTKFYYFSNFFKISHN